MITVRNWQRQAFKLGQSPNFLCVAPGGCGKSLLQCALGANELIKSGGRQRQLILIPQTSIAATFQSMQIEIGGKVLDWNLDLDFCQESHYKMKQLKLWLMGKLRGVTAITTHQGFCYVWKNLDPIERVEAIRETTFRIDEAHHIAGVCDVDEDQVDEEQSTQLGDFVQFAWDHNDNTNLHLTTATFHRGDVASILSPKVKERFSTYELTWEEHFPSLNLELFFEYKLYDQDPLDQICEAVAKEPDEHHLIILPSIGSKFRHALTLERLLAKLPTNMKVLDLVTVNKQRSGKIRLARHPDSFNVVVACGIFNEGTDWVKCSRLHNSDAPEQSLTLALQRFFRPLRRDPGKKNVRIINYLRDFNTEMDAESKRKIISDRFNCILFTMATAGELLPMNGKVHKGASGSWSTAFGKNYQPLLLDIIRGYEASDKTAESMTVLVEDLIIKYGVPEGTTKEQVQHFLQRHLLNISSPKNQSFEIKALQDFNTEQFRESGFDKIWAAQERGSCLHWGSTKITAETLREVCDSIKFRNLPEYSYEEIVEGLRKYYERTGVCPTTARCSETIDELGGIVVSTLQSRLIKMGSTIFKVMFSLIGFDALRSRPVTVEECREGLIKFWDREGYVSINKNTWAMPVPELYDLTVGSINKKLVDLGTSYAQLKRQVQGKPLYITSNKGINLDLMMEAFLKHVEAHGLPNFDEDRISNLGLTYRSFKTRLYNAFKTSLKKQLKLRGLSLLRVPHPRLVRRSTDLAQSHLAPSADIG